MSATEAAADLAVMEALRTGERDRSEIMQITGLANMTAYRTLKRLEEVDLVKGVAGDRGKMTYRLLPCN